MFISKVSYLDVILDKYIINQEMWALGSPQGKVVWLRTAFFYYAVLPGSIEISDNSTVNLKILVVNFCFAIGS